MADQEITLNGSGRTDAGVHAYGQVANFLCDTDHTPEIFLNGLNSLLPDDIVIKACEEVPEDFHARFSAKSKTYHYRIINRRVPPAVGRQYAWFIRKKLDVNAMRKAAEILAGKHDFKAFEGAGSPRSSTERHVMKAELHEQDDGLLIFEIQADGFLRFMVRNIVGTLVDVGFGKVTPDQFKEILTSRDRSKAGATAPAQGLFLMEVEY